MKSPASIPDGRRPRLRDHRGDPRRGPEQVAAAEQARPGGPTTLAEEGFVTLFNGKDLTGWKIPEGDNGHWKVVDGVIDYDARSEAKGDKDLVSEKEYGNFVLKFDWRIKDTPWVNPNIPYVLPDGTHARGVDGKELKLALPDSDSGVYPPRRQDRQEPGQHLVLADRLGRGLRLPDRPQDVADRPRRGHARSTRPTSRWASGTRSRSRSSTTASPWS